MSGGTETRGRPAARAALLSLAVLLATADDRFFGVITDGQQMLSAAAALARHGELGISRDYLSAVPREGPRGGPGDALSRYGMGWPLVEVVPMTAARLLRSVFPRASSAPLFSLTAILLAVSAAWAAARATLSLGASDAVATAAGVSLALATPLWPYVSSDFSEPLQAAAMALLVAATAKLRTAPAAEPAWEVVAGAAAGLALLTKSLLLVPALPLLALAAWRGRSPASPRGRPAPGAVRWRVVAAFAGFAAVWAFFELHRFGTLFGGYPNERFSYPFVTGLVRLTVFPNRGLLVYAPIVLLAPFGAWRLASRDRRLALALAGSSLALLLVVSCWWAWDGQAGWGPRLLVPALPALVVLAAVGVEAFRARADALGRAGVAFAALLAAAGAGVNAVGALQPFPNVFVLIANVKPLPIDEGRAAGTSYWLSRGPDGTLLAASLHHLSLTPSWWPPRLHARMLREGLRGGDVAARLADAFGDLDPPFRPEFPKSVVRTGEGAEATLGWGFWNLNVNVEVDEVVLAATRPWRWPHWGRAWREGNPPPPADTVAERPFGGVHPDRLALRDQAVRALDLLDFRRARALGEELLRTGPEPPDPRDLALAAEAASRAGDAETAGRLVGRSDAPCHYAVLYVKARLGGDFGCLPPSMREPFERNVLASQRAGLSLTEWSRRLRSGG